MKKTHAFFLALTITGTVCVIHPASATAMVFNRWRTQPLSVASSSPNINPLLHQQRITKIQALSDKLQGVFNRHQTNLQKLIDLGYKRADRLRSRGKNTTALDADLAKAQQDLSTAGSAGSQAASSVRVINLDLTNQNDDINQAKATVKQAQQAYVQVVSDLRQAVNDIRAIK